MINLIGKRSFWLSALAFWERSAKQHRSWQDIKAAENARYWAGEAKGKLFSVLGVE